jgi:negative regulator of sigma E activity
MGDDGNLPPPTPELLIIAAGLVELEVALRELGLKKPDFTERVLARLQSEAMRQAVVRLRGPRVTPEMSKAMDGAEAWLAQTSVAVKAMRRA